VAALAGAGVLLFVVIVLIRWPAKFTELPIGKIAATVFMLTLFGVCFASIAYGIGAYTGRRAISLGAGAYVAVVTYLCSSFLTPDPRCRLGEVLSPFAWYLDGQPLLNGINWFYCGLLAAVAVAFAALGVWQFRRRDLT